VSRTINVGIIGTGWIGEIRARTCAAHPLVESLHLAEIDEARLARVAKETRARSATADYRELLQRKEIDAIIVSTTPETTHYPFTRDCLLARKHTFLEKPMGLELKEADELMALARRGPPQAHHRLHAALQPEIRLRESSGSWRRGASGDDSRHIAVRHTERKQRSDQEVQRNRRIAGLHLGDA
jgi:hypothetical protein